MSISSYQIQNIIQTYNRQLKSNFARRPHTPPVKTETPSNDIVKISDEGKKQVVMESAGEDAVRSLRLQTLELLKK